MDIFTILIISHIGGAVLGVGGATFIEIFLTKSLRDGVIDPTEGSFLKTTFFVVRIGLILSLISGFGLLLLYRFEDQAFKLYDPTLWAKMTVLGVLVINALLLQAHRIPLWLGSALSLVSWYTVMTLGILLRGPSYPYWEIIFYYVIAVLIGAVILNGIRRMLGIKT